MIVGITEADIQSPENQPRSGSLADPLLLKLLKVLDQGKPRVIGLDIYRDFSTTLPGLKQQLQTNDRLITICKRPDTKDDPTGIKPPPEVPIDSVGFSDFVQDIDSGIRRHLIAMDPVSTSRCSTGLAFSTLLALQFLSEENITAEFDQDQLRIGNRRLRSLRHSPGGYLGQELDGLQLLLNYRRNPQGIAQMVTLQEMLSGQVPDEAIRDRIILIGVVSPNSSDRWATPFGNSFAQKQSGVVVQAQMVSQILSAVQDQRPLIYPVPLTQLLLWSFAWGLLGGLLGGWRSRYRLLLLVGGLVALWVVGGGWLILGSWVPLAMPTITFLSSAVLIAQLNSFTLIPNKSNTGKD